MCYFYFNRYDKFHCQKDNESGHSDNENGQIDHESSRMKKGSQEERECRF